jgi:hypothetical protein
MKIDKHIMSKSKTLEFLENRLISAKVLPQFEISHRNWVAEPLNQLKSLFDKLSKFDLYIVRSSTNLEDKLGDSQAGKYLSTVSAGGFEQLREQIDLVFDSYDSKDGQVVFIQEYKNFEHSGVAFNRDINSGAKYITINTSSDNDTFAVTGGDQPTSIDIFYRDKFRTDFQKGINDIFLEIENIFGDIPLDIEFGFDKGVLYLLQLRELKINLEIPSISHEGLVKALDEVNTFLTSKMAKHPYLYGNSTFFGNMTDWNPAEIIGVKAKPLAFSLYRDLITDNTWAYQRHNYGYRNLRGFPLMFDIGGHPYIDIRTSFNSFLPKNLNENIGTKLVDYYLKQLEEKPELHDKVEFEVVLSCLTPATQSRLDSADFDFLYDSEKEEFKDSLRNLTATIINSVNGKWIADSKKIEILLSKNSFVMSSNLSTVEKIYWLLEDCRRYGTLPFAGLARSAFVATESLKALVQIDLISKDNLNSFLNSTFNITSEIRSDFIELDRQQFLLKYGHLRPDSYNIESDRYDENPAKYFGNIVEPNFDTIDDSANNFSFSTKSITSLNGILSELDIHTNSIDYLFFIKEAIRLRELSKFLFTKNLSDALKLIGDLGNDFELTKQELSFVDINVIKNAVSSSDNLKSELKRSIDLGKEKYEITSMVNLPDLITHPNDVYGHTIREVRPNFITTKVIEGLICDPRETSNLTDKIIILENADPGYDWIFFYNIKGLVTKYGGSNSHMAIRCNELSIPAVIGCGEIIYSKFLTNSWVRIDCEQKKLSI